MLSDKEKDRILAAWQNLRAWSELNDAVTEVTICKIIKNVEGQIYVHLPLNLNGLYRMSEIMEYILNLLFHLFYQVGEGCVNVNMCWINPVITVAPYNDVFPGCHITVDYYFFFFAILHLISIPHPGVNIPDNLNSF